MKTSQKKFLIVGSNAGASIQLAKYFLNQGDLVYGISRESSFPGSHIYIENVTYDKSYAHILFDYVVVIGSRTPSSGGQLNDFITDNLSIVLKAINEGKNAAKIVFFSSASVYNQSTEKITKKSFYTDNDPYGISKLLCENYIKDNCEKYLILRIPVLLFPNVKNNFMARLKKAINEKGSFNFSNPEAKVNTFFRLDDFHNINSNLTNATVNCYTKIDWSIQDIINYSISLGLSNYKILESIKPPQTIEEISDFPVSDTSTSIMEFLDE